MDIAKSLVNIKAKPVKPKRGKKVYFSLIPFGGNVRGGNGRALMTSTTANIYFGPMENTTASTATFAPYWNFGDRFGLPQDICQDGKNINSQYEAKQYGGSLYIKRLVFDLELHVGV